MPAVLITGAGSGIGRAAAIGFAADGWRCVLVDRDADALQRVLGQLTPAPAAAGTAGPHEARCIDLTDAAQIATLATLGRPIAAVINNAGMSDSSAMPLVEQPPSRQARLAALNLAAPAAVVRAVDRLLEPGARIVNVASGAGLRSIPWRGYYSPTKAGLIAQTRALALARPDLAVTVLCPGFVRTELVEGLIDSGRIDPRLAVAKVPLGRMADPAEMAAMMRFLASPAARLLHGQVLALCGGSSIYGGSKACEPATLPMRPFDAPLVLTVRGDPAGRWSALATSPDAAGYPAVLDARALQAGADPWSPERGGLGPVADAIHQSAREFVRHNPQSGSLTLLLPADPGPDATAWERAGEAAAARMLVATLASELGPRALRVNAIEVGPDLDAAALAPLVRQFAGAGSQFLTGQTLAARHP